MSLIKWSLISSKLYYIYLRTVFHNRTLIIHTLNSWLLNTILLQFTQDGIPYTTKFGGQNFCQTKYFGGQNFRHQDKISTMLTDFSLTFVLKSWAKFSTDKIFDTNPKCYHSSLYPSSAMKLYVHSL